MLNGARWSETRTCCSNKVPVDNESVDGDMIPCSRLPSRLDYHDYLPGGGCPSGDCRDGDVPLGEELFVAIVYCLSMSAGDFVGILDCSLEHQCLGLRARMFIFKTVNDE